MRESKSKMSEKRVSKEYKYAKKYNKLKDVNKRKIGSKRTYNETVSPKVHSGIVDVEYKRTCDSPNKSECSEDGSGTDQSASSVSGGDGSQSSRGRSSQLPSTNKKQGISGITFQPGTRLEAKDLGNGIWYAVKVVEVDWEEDEILIHFEKWSQRYDEWVPMDSSRLRPVTEPPGGFVKKAPKIFKVGDKVMATWSDSRKYPASVKTILGNDKYEVLFFDGFSKTIKGGRMIPLKEEELAKIQKMQPGIGPSNDVTNPTSLKPDPNSQMMNRSLATELGTKEERRERKRKLNVAELFHFKKRPRLDGSSAQISLDGKKAQRAGKFGSQGGRKKSQWPIEGSFSGNDLPSRDTGRVDQQIIGKPVEKHLETVEENLINSMENKKRETISKGKSRYKSVDLEKTTKRSKSESLGQKNEDDANMVCDKKIRQKMTKHREGGKRSQSQGKREKGTERLDSRGRKKESEGDTSKPVRAIDDWEPVGEPAYIVDGTDGPRKSIIVADPRIPHGWTRHTIQRMSGHSAGKWDVFFVNPDGRKFRTRNELRVYYEERGEVFPTEQFDFSLGRRKNKNSMEAKGLDSTSVSHGSASKGGRPTGQASAHLSMLIDPSDTPVRRVKTLLPRVRPFNVENTALSTPSALCGSDGFDNSGAISDGSVVLGGLKIQKENDAFRCPKEGCNKNFRKENLLQMHMKHYHPEYNRFVASTPNVADLAYARTVGERLEELHPRSQRTSVLDKISRFEALRRARGSSVENGSSSPAVLSSSSVVNLSESPVVSLSPIISLTSRTSPMTLHRRIVDMDPGESMSAAEISDVAMPPRSPSLDCGEASQSSVRTLMPVIRSALGDVSLQGAGNDTSLTNLLSVGLNEINSQSPCDTSSLLEEKVEERECDNQSSLPAAGICHTKSLRMVRRRHMSDFHMEPLLKKRKSEAEDSSQNTLLNGNLSRQARTESLRREELINCTCGYPEEDGLMIQCDLCMCWQHGLCNNIEHEDHVPEKYVCYICQHPSRERQSKHFLHDQDWLKEGHLPSLSFRSKNIREIAHRENMFKHSHDLTGSLLQLQDVIHSLRVKVNIAEKKDHPKLYLWAHSWEKSVDSSQVQSTTDYLVNLSGEERLIKNEYPEDAKEKTVIKGESVEIDNTKADCSHLVNCNSSDKNIIEQTFNLIEEKPNISSPRESADLLADECDTKDTSFSQETSDSAKEETNALREERNLLETKASDMTEAVVLENNIDIATETEVATVEMEIDHKDDSSMKNMCDMKIEKSNSRIEEQIAHSSPTEVLGTDETLVSSKTCNETEDNPEDKDDDLQLSLCQNNLAAISSIENPIHSMDISVVKEPSRKIVQCAPQPEAPIDPAECRMTLLDHIDYLQHEVELRLSSIESNIEALEKVDPATDNEQSSDLRTKQTIQMLLRDLAAVYDIAAFN